ncbi:SEL1-like repeat protein [Acinetobacter baumannii]|nr:SEL1-like repeat protein [Acinetobacter baumannii]
MNAQFNLGILYAKGLGVSKNYEIAKQWIEKAAEQGHENAKIIITQLAS